jgi:hypothetical protein
MPRWLDPYRLSALSLAIFEHQTQVSANDVWHDLRPKLGKSWVVSRNAQMNSVYFE